MALHTKNMPRAMRIAPQLDPPGKCRGVRRHCALLVNPFYPKDPHASFGKHVLTPTLALTTVAAATPETWEVSYWDENLLQGPPPGGPLPEVAGITVHLTFAARAFQLARWYREQGTTVVLGGLHVPHMKRDVDQIVSEFEADDQPCAVFTDNNPGSKPDHLRQLCRALRPLEKIWSAAVSID